MSYQTTVLADGPIRYFPLDETSGTVATELVSSANGSYQGAITVGGSAAPSGIGGVAPLLHGTAGEFIQLASGALLSGLTAWTIEVWLSGGGTGAMFSERGSSGNDIIRFSFTSPTMTARYGDDADVPTTYNSPDTFGLGAFPLLHLVRSGSSLQVWYDGALRNAFTLPTATAGATNAGIDSRAGHDRVDGLQFNGSLAHLALYNKALTQQQIQAHYIAGTPITRRPAHSQDKIFRANAVWKQRLPDDAPIDANSATYVSGLLRIMAKQAATSVATNNGGGPFYTVDHTQSTQRVRIEGGPYNFGNNPSELYAALGSVPIPPGMVTGTNTDLEVQIFNTDTNELFEFWVMRQNLVRPHVGSAVAQTTAGSLAAGNYQYLIVGYGGDVQTGIGPARQTSTVTLSATGQVVVTGGYTEAASEYRVYRSKNGAAYTRVAQITNTGLSSWSWTDTGVADGALYTSEPSAITSDWGCYYGGYQNQTDQWVGRYEPPHANWGAAATSLPLWGGTISLEEAAAGVINHALAMALPETRAGVFVYPANRSDGGTATSDVPQEGTRFRLPATFDVNTLANPFQRMIGTAMRDYGIFVRDISGGTSVYIEDDQATGRAWYPMIYNGQMPYEILQGFPWGSLQAVAPSWTLAATTQAPTQPSARARSVMRRRHGRR